MSLSSRHWTSGIGAPCRRISRWCGAGEGSGARSERGDPGPWTRAHPSITAAAGRIRCPGSSGRTHAEPLGRGISHINLCASGQSGEGKGVKATRRIARKSQALCSPVLVMQAVLWNTTEPLLSYSISKCLTAKCQSSQSVCVLLNVYYLLVRISLSSYKSSKLGWYDSIHFNKEQNSLDK